MADQDPSGLTVKGYIELILKGEGAEDAIKKLSGIKKEAVEAGSEAANFARQLDRALGGADIQEKMDAIIKTYDSVAEVMHRVGISAEDELPNVKEFLNDLDSSGEALLADTVPAFNILLASTQDTTKALIGVSRALEIAKEGGITLKEAALGLAALLAGRVTEAAEHFRMETKDANGEMIKEEVLLKQIQERFSGVATAAKQAGDKTKETVNETGKSAGKFKEILAGIGNAIGGPIGAVTGIATGTAIAIEKIVEVAGEAARAVKEFFVESFQEGVRAERQFNILVDRYERLGKSPENAKRLRETLFAIQDLGGAVSEEAIPVFTQFLALTENEEDALLSLRLASDIAESGVTSLAGAAQLLTNVFQGRASIAAQRLGIHVKDANGQMKTNEQLVKEIIRVYGGLSDRLDDAQNQLNKTSSAWKDVKTATGEALAELYSTLRIGNVVSAGLGFISGAVRLATTDVRGLTNVLAALSRGAVLRGSPKTYFENLKTAAATFYVEFETERLQAMERIKTRLGVKDEKKESPELAAAKRDAQERYLIEFELLRKTRDEALASANATAEEKKAIDQQYSAGVLLAQQERNRRVRDAEADDAEREQTKKAAVIVEASNRQLTHDLKVLTELRDAELQNTTLTVKDKERIEEDYQGRVKQRRERAAKEQKEAAENASRLEAFAATSSAKERAEAVNDLEKKAAQARISLLEDGNQERLALERQQLDREWEQTRKQLESLGVPKLKIDEAYLQARTALYERWGLSNTEQELRQKEVEIRGKLALEEQGSRARLEHEKELVRLQYQREIELAERNKRDATYLRAARDRELQGMDERFERDRRRRAEGVEIELNRVKAQLAGEASDEAIALEQRTIEIEHRQAVEDAKRRHEDIAKIDDLYRQRRILLDKQADLAKSQRAGGTEVRIIEAQLTTTEPGSQDAMALTERMLAVQHQMEIDAAKARGEDITQLELAQALERSDKLLEVRRAAFHRELDDYRDLIDSQYDLDAERAKGEIDLKQQSNEWVFKELQEEAKHETEHKAAMYDLELEEKLGEIKLSQETADAKIDDFKEVEKFRVEVGEGSPEEKAKRIEEIEQRATEAKRRNKDNADKQEERARKVHDNRILAAQQSLTNALINLSKAEKDAKVGAYLQAAAAIGGALSSMFSKNKSVAIVAAIIETLAGAQAAFSQTPGPIWVKVAAAAAATAQGFARVRAIKETTMGSGEAAAAEAAPVLRGGATPPTTGEQGGASIIQKGTATLGFDNPLHDLLARQWGRQQAEDIVRHVGLGYMDRMADMARGPAPVSVQDVSREAGAAFTPKSTPPAGPTDNRSYNFNFGNVYGGRVGKRKLKREINRLIDPKFQG